MTGHNNAEFLQGFAIALADMDRLHDNPVAVRDTIENAAIGRRLTYAELIA